MTPINLTHSEPVEFDHDILANLCDTHGEGTENFIASVLMQIELVLDVAEQQIKHNELRGIRRSCEDLIALADTIGMTTLHRAARAVMESAAEGAEHAFAACGQRMLRLGRPDTIEHWTVSNSTVA